MSGGQEKKSTTTSKMIKIFLLLNMFLFVNFVSFSAVCVPHSLVLVGTFSCVKIDERNAQQEKKRTRMLLAKPDENRQA